VKIKTALCGDNAWELQRVFGQGRREHLEILSDLLPITVTSKNFASRIEEFMEVEVVFATWGMDQQLAVLLSDLPKLRACFYAAGTVQHFARPLLDKGILVVSAWAANAVPVAQFTVAQILLSLKGYFQNVRESHLPSNHGKAVPTLAPGILGSPVALLGCGMVGRTVVDLLRPFEVDILVYDPFLNDSDAMALGVQKVSLEAAFASAQVVSNHLADLAPTRGLLVGSLFDSMRKGATFINTGRGATVVEAELIQVLGRREDLTALLDVFSPEPPLAGSRWYALPNVQISSHIAGSQANEVVRLADYCLEEFEVWCQGGPLRFEVTLSMLEKMA
jgi:phosphoglycerate dehydrogenase-like enzyme